VPRCARPELRLRAGAQGTAAEVVVFVTVMDHAGPCSLSGSMRFTIEQNGRLARLEGNPASFAMAGRRDDREAVVMPSFWWGNWCGGRRGLSGVVSYSGLVERIRFPVLPDCVDHTRPSGIGSAWWG